MTDQSIDRLKANGRFEYDDGMEWYRIEDYDQLDPFLINVVAPDDQWVYVSSSGALTAGRRTVDRALFPYETDDRLHRNGGLTGPLTIIRPTGGGQTWEPFAPWTTLKRQRRSLAKSATGDRLRFEEHNQELGLTFRATWATAGEYGLIRSCELLADGKRQPIEVELLDGLLDVLPAGVELADQQATSTLVDAYRRSELDGETGLALFTLEARISDRADPAEALSANVIWTRGLDQPTVALSDRQVRKFRSGYSLEPEHLATGRKGSFLVSTVATVHPDAALRWVMAADVAKDHLAVAALRRRLLHAADPVADIESAITRSTAELVSIVAEADGVQQTADRRTTVHHFANTLFNCMRGGAFLDDHRIELAEVEQFIGARNRAVKPRFSAATAGLEPVLELEALRTATADDPDLVRLVSEYLPLTFSRRHGDPSRPWNRFSIPAPRPDSRPAYGYEGNWRDIFQNWEALIHSFPGYIESIVAKFLNASTMDGHNPYRITDRGLDWEQPEEGSWGNFGYWGDHQIVYLHRLLDAAERFHPGLLASKIDARVFSFGDVPYRIAPYDDLVADPKHTLAFGDARQSMIDRRVEAMGADGRLLVATDGPGDLNPAVHHATLAEKLLIPALAKLSNLVAGAGIWMNTQRPEWNDANNALVGNGVSTVTLLQLRDYLAFVDNLLAKGTTEVRIGEPVLAWMTDLGKAFDDHHPVIEVGVAGDAMRRSLLDRLGRAFETYRSEVYRNGPGATALVEVSQIRQLLATAGPHLDHAAGKALRPDGLFHAYWLLRLAPDAATIEALPEMLEGQAAVLDSTATEPAVALQLVDALFDSELYRPDQRSFVLYPNHPPPPFLDKNLVPEELVGPALQALLDADCGVVRRDVDGAVRFGPEFQSGRHLGVVLDLLESDQTLHQISAAQISADQISADQMPGVQISPDQRAEIEAAYEAVFNHRAFTGRSRTMYRYEGLGSVYWHMVSKLLFGIQERFLEAFDHGEDQETLTTFATEYGRIRSGLGFMKSVAEQGAFPTDPHSHTPAHGGAQQPGMTGQVKEGVLIRLGELGVRVDGGQVRFQPLLLDRNEFLSEPQVWSTPNGGAQLEAGTLGFTYCGVPIVYRLHDGDAWTRVTWSDDRTEESRGPELDRVTSRALFSRDGSLSRIDVGVSVGSLRFGGRW